MVIVVLIQSLNAVKEFSKDVFEKSKKKSHILDCNFRFQKPTTYGTFPVKWDFFGGSPKFTDCLITKV